MSAIGYEFCDGVSWSTLAAPDAGNPFTMPVAEQLLAAVQRSRRDDAHVTVLRAQGRAFSVGGDVKAFAGAEDPGRFVQDLAEVLHRAVSDLHRHDTVVVSAVQGVAAGAGFSLAAAADVVLAAEAARFTMAYTKIGLSPDGGACLLVNTVGLHRTLAIGLLNSLLTAREAQAAGLVHEVVPDAELEAATQTVVQQLRQGSRVAQVATRRLIRGLTQPIEEGQLRQESLSISRAAASPDGIEGVAAFLGKRTPVWPGN